MVDVALVDLVMCIVGAIRTDPVMFMEVVIRMDAGLVAMGLVAITDIVITVSMAAISTASMAAISIASMAAISTASTEVITEATMEAVMDIMDITEWALIR